MSYWMTAAPLVADGLFHYRMFRRRIRCTRLHRRLGRANRSAPLADLLPVAGPGEPGNETWPGDNWKRGGGAARLTGPSIQSSTPSTGALAIPVRGMPSIGRATIFTLVQCWRSIQRPGIKWHYQFSPNNPFDSATAAVRVGSAPPDLSCCGFLIPSWSLS
jgi:alcohol dehydrogenase (cytochrome c)